MDKFMKIALEEAFLGVKSNHGGPFGAVIVKNGLVVAKGHNEVILTNDPTAHAEIVTIRLASAFLKLFDLSDCEIYSSCEPCPMCLSAIFWSRIKRVYYGCNKDDASEIGFDDKNIYEFIKNPDVVDTLKLFPVDREECLQSFKAWQNKEDQIRY